MGVSPREKRRGKGEGEGSGEETWVYGGQSQTEEEGDSGEESRVPEK